jgi:hypothetical protein
MIQKDYSGSDQTKNFWIGIHNYKLAAACLLLTDGGGIEICNFHFFSTQAAAEIYF